MNQTTRHQRKTQKNASENGPHIIPDAATAEVSDGTNTDQTWEIPNLPIKPVRVQERNERFLREEIANTITHGVGFLLAIAGSIWLLVATAGTVGFTIQVGCWVYVASLMGVYAASTLSHVVLEPKRRHFFRSLDQGMIFLFIAGNFTPVALLLLSSASWSWLLPVMWIVAITGFCSKIVWKYRVESVAVTHYLALGWLPVTATQPLLEALPTAGLFWSVAGGLCYTTGVLFLICDAKVPYFHAVWHLLVIAGSTCHFFAVVNYILPA